MTIEELQIVKRQINVRQNCIHEHHAARADAIRIGDLGAARRHEEAIESDQRQIDDLEMRIDRHWYELFDLREVPA